MLKKDLDDGGLVRLDRVVQQRVTMVVELIDMVMCVVVQKAAHVLNVSVVYFVNDPVVLVHDGQVPNAPAHHQEPGDQRPEDLRVWRRRVLLRHPLAMAPNRLLAHLAGLAHGLRHRPQPHLGAISVEHLQGAGDPRAPRACWSEWPF